MTNDLQPLSVSAIPASSIPSADSDEYTAFLVHYVRQAFSLVRATATWKRGKTFTTPDGGRVLTICGPSGMPGKLAKLNWQMRESLHSEADFDVTYDDFREGLLLDHARNEQKYIPSLIESKEVLVVKKDQAEVWRNSYKLPIVTTDRDFVELILTVDLADHPEPYSQAHEEATVAKLQGQETATSEGYRSFMVIQLPVSHDEEPERKELVRAYYASVEAVCQRDEDAVEWKMMVQSDSAGKIPVFLQEMSMPGKIAEDVPLFIEWLHKKKFANV